MIQMFCMYCVLYICFVWIIASHTDGLILKDESDCYHANIFSLLNVDLRWSGIALL